MLPRMTRSAFCPQAVKRKHSAPAKRRRLIGPSTEFGDAVDRLERRDGIGARALVCRDGGRARLRGERVTDVEQDFEEQLLPLVDGVEVGHAGVIVGGLGSIVRFAVNGLEVGEDAVAGARTHGSEKIGPLDKKGIAVGSFPEVSYALLFSRDVGLLPPKAF